MPKRVIFFLSLGCIAIAVLILFISIVVSSSVYQIDGVNGQRMGRRFYIGRKILPDHIFYPLLNVSDISLLSITKEADKYELELEVAQRRLESARDLQISDQRYAELTLLTFNKSHNYLLQAGERLLAIDSVSVDQLAYFQNVIEQRIEVFSEIAEKLTDSQRARVDAIVHEEEVLKSKVGEKYKRLMMDGGN